MSLELHNFIWEEVRFVQVETQPHHLAGVLANIRDVLDPTSEWESLYSAYYECKEDGTITFFEGESAEAGNPGIFTYVVYDCFPNEEEVVKNIKIDNFEPVLKFKNLVSDVIYARAITSLDKQVEELRYIALKNGFSPEKLLFARVETSNPPQNPDFDEATRYVLEKNAELYRRLA